MGTHIHIEVEIPMSRDEYWPLIFTREFDEFQAPYISMKKAIEVYCEEKESTVVRRRVKMLPNMELPSALLWYLGQTEFHYHDDQVKDLVRGTVVCQTTPPVLQDRVKISGVVRVEPLCDATCLHVADFHIEISAFGLGGLIEGVMAANVENSHFLIRRAVEAWKEYRQTGVRRQVGAEAAQTLVAQMPPHERQKILFMINGERRGHSAAASAVEGPGPGMWQPRASLQRAEEVAAAVAEAGMVRAGKMNGDDDSDDVNGGNGAHHQHHNHHLNLNGNNGNCHLNGGEANGTAAANGGGIAGYLGSWWS